MKYLSSALILIFLLPCILCFFNDTSEEGTEIQMRRRKVKRCDLVDFVGYNSPGRCCLQSPGSPAAFTQSMADMCNNGVLFDDTYLFEYRFNRLMTPANHFTVNFGKKKQIPTSFAKVACIGSCMSTLSGLMDSNHALIKDGVKAILGLFALPAWLPVINDGIEACTAYMQPMLHVNVTLYEKHKPPRQCLVGPLLLTQCVQTYLIGRCPPSLQIANPSERCMDEIAGMDQCSAMFNLPPLFPTSESNSDED